MGALVGGPGARGWPTPGLRRRSGRRAAGGGRGEGPGPDVPPGALRPRPRLDTGAGGGPRPGAGRGAGAPAASRLGGRVQTPTLEREPEPAPPWSTRFGDKSCGGPEGKKDPGRGSLFRTAPALKSWTEGTSPQLPAAHSGRAEPLLLQRGWSRGSSQSRISGGLFLLEAEPPMSTIYPPCSGHSNKEELDCQALTMAHLHGDP